MVTALAHGSAGLHDTCSVVRTEADLLERVQQNLVEAEKQAEEKSTARGGEDSRPKTVTNSSR